MGTGARAFLRLSGEPDSENRVNAGPSEMELAGRLSNPDFLKLLRRLGGSPGF
jgi:hypothetical protein